MSVVATDSIPPGGATEIRTIFDTAKRSGKVRKDVTVRSNDPDRPEIKLHLLANILVNVRVEPRVLDLGRLAAGETAEREFTVTLLEPAKTPVLGAAVDDERFALERVETGRPGLLRYRLRFAGAQEPGRVQARVVVRYRDKKEREVWVTVTGRVAGPLDYPRVLRFIRGESGFAPRTITITARPGQTVRIESVEDPAGLLDLTLLAAEGERALIRAAVARPDVDYSEPLRRQLRVTTSAPEASTFTIDYTIHETRRR